MAADAGVNSGKKMMPLLMLSLFMDVVELVVRLSRKVVSVGSSRSWSLASIYTEEEA